MYSDPYLLAMLRSRTKRSLYSHPARAKDAVHCLETVDLEIGGPFAPITFHKAELQSAGSTANIVIDPCALTTCDHQKHDT